MPHSRCASTQECMDEPRRCRARKRLCKHVEINGNNGNNGGFSKTKLSISQHHFNKISLLGNVFSTIGFHKPPHNFNKHCRLYMGNLLVDVF